MGAENCEAAWDKLLATVMRWRSAGYVVAMMIGGILYDPHSINYFLADNFKLSADVVHRLPVVLVLCQALVCLFITIKMIEPARENKLGRENTVHLSTSATIKKSIQLTLSTARWVLTHPKLLAALLVGVAMDSIVRNFATINSSYFRLIDLHEWTYGFIGAGTGLLGWFVPTIAQKLNTRFSMIANLGFTALGILIGLAALIPAWRIVGILPAVFLMTTMGFLGFTLSRVLNQEADSSKRATVLSVKGLVFNVGYGAFSLAFSLLLASFPNDPKDTALRSALMWQLPYFVVIMIFLFVWASIFMRDKK